MFGLVNFRINRVLQNTFGGGVGDSRAFDIRQWILADCDVGHQMYTNNDIVSLYFRRKVVKKTQMKVI
jgi:hypothetical protein